jgi:LEA14-like dessication related protein
VSRMIAAKRWPSLIRLATESGLALLLAGCAAVNFQAPAVTPTSVELMDAQVLEQRFKVQLHVQNPNDRPLPIKSVSCTLEVSGVDVGHGESSEPFTIPAQGEGDFDMIVTTNFATSVPNLLLRLAQGKELPTYRLSGKVNPDIRFMPSIPFEKSGQINPN